MEIAMVVWVIVQIVIIVATTVLLIRLHKSNRSFFAAIEQRQQNVDSLKRELFGIEADRQEQQTEQERKEEHQKSKRSIDKNNKNGDSKKN